MDCHYLITARSPATETPAVGPTVDEHRLLYDVTAMLMNHVLFMAGEVYASRPLPARFPAIIADAERGQAEAEAAAEEAAKKEEQKRHLRAR
jgi:hypothetical protein